jgi:hypothetical protein
MKLLQIKIAKDLEEKLETLMKSNELLQRTNEI